MFYGNILNEAYNNLPTGTLGGELKNCKVWDKEKLLDDKLKKVIVNLYNTKIKKAINDYIDTIFDKYQKKNNTIKLDEVKKLATKLIDYVSVYHNLKDKNKICIDYFVNNWYKENKGNEKFLGYDVTVIGTAIIDAKSYSLLEVQCSDAD